MLKDMSVTAHAAPAAGLVGWAPRDLWQLASEVTQMGRLDALRLPATDPLVVLCEEASTSCVDAIAGTDFDQVRDAHDTEIVWMALAARLGGLRGDLDMCAAPSRLLLPHADEFLMLGSFLAVGPAGWFVADALAALGGIREAVVANAAAGAASRHLRAHDWSARCREQEDRLGRLGASAVRSCTGESGREVFGRSASGAAARRDHVSPVSAVVPPQRDDVEAALSARQLEILRWAASGLTNAMIAERLFVSVATVERHCTIAYRALGVRNRAQALGLIDPFRASASA